jgi:hypothetical protein
LDVSVKITKKQLDNLVNKIIKEQVQRAVPNSMKYWKELFMTMGPEYYGPTSTQAPIWERPGARGWRWEDSKYLTRFNFNTNDSDEDGLFIKITYTENGKFDFSVFDAPRWGADEVLKFEKKQMHPQAVGNILRKILKAEAGWF